MKINIDYKYVQLNFDYTWLRDKQIILRGNWEMGMLVIVDADGRTVGMYAYEQII
tara:strand:+ start:199 stop:363 length:165 start_codon:yes stop_codon:yes gene_type:complete